MTTTLLTWLLAAAALLIGWQTSGWQGIAVAVTVIVFWLLLHFNRAIRAMRNAARRPVGSIASAVMVHAKLHTGMSMVQVLTLTRSLGQQVAETPETWQWRDEGGSTVTVELVNGRVIAWKLNRPADSDATSAA